jgi:hypothetical protein
VAANHKASTGIRRHFPLICSHEAFGIENLHRAHKYFFHIVMQRFWEISRDTTFTTVNLPIGTVYILKGHFPVYFDLSLRRYAVAM